MNRKERAGGRASKSTCPLPTKPAKCGPTKGPGKAGKAQGKSTKGPAFPAFSLGLPPPATYEEQQKEKMKIIRRNKPKGEDINKLKQIVKSVRERPVNVYELIGLVAPSTADNGKELQRILGEELSLFRSTSRKIYETMTEDISDVLVNEQIQLKEYTSDRYALYDDKLVRNLNEILEYCPDFNFDLFYTQDEYLDDIFPLAEVEVDQETLESLWRQEAFHRYHWLKSEGERLKQENTRLQKRLKDLKKRQKDELNVVAEKEQKADEKRKLLEAAQEVLEERLEDLSESLGKSFVESEIAQATPLSLQPLKPKPKITERFKALRSARRKPDWASQQAAEIETTQAMEAVTAEVSKVSLRAKNSKKRGTIKGKSKRAPPPDQSTAFHYSPIKTPPLKQAAGPSTSPFHYSPIKTPPLREPTARSTSPFHYSPIRTPPLAQAAGPSTSPFHYSPKTTPRLDANASVFQYPPVNAPSRVPSGPSTSPFHYSPVHTTSSRDVSPVRTRSGRPAPPTSPFHYSPIHTPNELPGRSTSPFHYSPIQTPVRAPAQDNAELSRSQAEVRNTTRVKLSTSRVTTEREPAPRRRARAPPDTWRGFQ